MPLTREESSRELRKTQEARKQRQWQRYEVTIPVCATITLNAERITVHGRGSDVSVGGMCLFLTRELELGTSLLLEFLLPYSSPRIAVRGVIRNRDGFSYGIEFVNLSAHQRQMIERTCKAFELLR